MVEEDHECGICLNKIRASKKQYGLLTGCKHTFCIECIRTWRGRTDIPRDIARGCPVCRLNTFVIIPSDIFLETAAEKEQVQETYQNTLSEKPCKHFNFGEGTCPFGTSCFYDHRYKNGETWKAPTPNFMMDADGEW
jgi:E3 ubiquitin-protein ligase makorin